MSVWKIRCSHPCEIEDLGIDLVRGVERCVSASVALQSKDLQREIRRGYVRVSRMGMRHGRPQQPAPPFIELSQRQQRRVPETQADAAATLRIGIDELREILREVVADEIQKLRDGWLSGAVAKGVERAPEYADTEPMYIPQRITTDLKGTVSVKTSLTEESLTDSTEALRELRRKAGRGATEENE